MNHTTDKEVWKPVSGWESSYEVSDLGRIRNANTGYIRKPVELPDGHMQIKLNHMGSWSMAAMHRLVLRAFVGRCPDGMECRHLDGNPANNSLNNLRWGTRKENTADALHHDTIKRGSDVTVSVLNEIQVNDLLDRFEAGEEGRFIASEFGISQQQFYKITSGQQWSHVHRARDALRGIIGSTAFLREASLKRPRKGPWLRELREHASISVIEMAAELECTTTHVYDVEKGRRNLSWEKLDRWKTLPEARVALATAVRAAQGADKEKSC